MSRKGRLRERVARRFLGTRVRKGGREGRNEGCLSGVRLSLTGTETFTSKIVVTAATIKFEQVERREYTKKSFNCIHFK